MAARGAQKGNRNAAKNKDWESALRRVIATFELKDDAGVVKVARGEALRKIAEQCVMQAIAGDKDARAEIANRLDGKPTEHVQVAHTIERRLSYAERLAQEEAARSHRASGETLGNTVQ